MVEGGEGGIIFDLRVLSIKVREQVIHPGGKEV
jgi:hypothetical protein